MSTYYFLLILFASSVSQAQLKYDGYWWTGLEQESTGIQESKDIAGLYANTMRLGYVMGVVEQVKADQMRYNVLYSYGKDSSTFAFKVLKSTFDPFYSATFGQFRDGVSEFYKDYRNLQITVINAMFVVTMEVRGEPQEEIDLQIRSLRSENDSLIRVYQRLLKEQMEMEKRSQ